MRIQWISKFRACPWKDSFPKPSASGTAWWKFSGKNVFYSRVYNKSKIANYSQEAKISCQEIVYLDIVFRLISSNVLDFSVLGTVFLLWRLTAWLFEHICNLLPQRVLFIQGVSIILSIQNFSSLNLSRIFYEKCIGDLNLFFLYSLWRMLLYHLVLQKWFFFLLCFRHHC